MGVILDLWISFSHFKTEKSLSTVAVLGNGQANPPTNSISRGNLFLIFGVLQASQKSDCSVNLLKAYQRRCSLFTKTRSSLCSSTSGLSPGLGGSGAENVFGSLQRSLSQEKVHWDLELERRDPTRKREKHETHLRKLYAEQDCRVSAAPFETTSKNANHSATFSDSAKMPRPTHRSADSNSWQCKRWQNSRAL